MRLIDADELIANVASIVDLRTLSTKTIGEAIAKTPTVDAVPVVRCRDCKSFSHGYCKFHDAKFVRPDGYCYWGKRKDEKDGDHHDTV